MDAGQLLKPRHVQDFARGSEQGFKGARQVATFFPEGFVVENLLDHRKAPRR